MLANKKSTLVASRVLSCGITRATAAFAGTGSSIVLANHSQILT